MNGPQPRRARGGALVELLVGVALGLAVVAIALVALVRQTADTRRLLDGLRAEHDAQAVAHLVARHLRRAGHWAQAGEAVWRPAMAGRAAARNPHVLSAEAGGALMFSYDRPGATEAASAEALGFRRQDQAVDMRLGASGWQPVTDPAVLTVRGLRLVPRVDTETLGTPCDAPCPSGAPCGAVAHRTVVDVQLDAHAPRLDRALHPTVPSVRLRNDGVVAGCAP